MLVGNMMVALAILSILALAKAQTDPAKPNFILLMSDVRAASVFCAPRGSAAVCLLKLDSQLDCPVDRVLI